MLKIEVFTNLEDLSRAGAERFVGLAERAVGAANRFTVALAGGSTPKSLYRLLASEAYRSRVEWNKTYFFWGDERCVPADSDKSNFKMANENLLAPARVPPSNVFRFKTELEPAAAAADYEKTLRDFFKPNRDEAPGFDLILLGMGADGHTASLFPGSAALGETTKLVAAPFVQKLDSYRLTLAPPAINNAANVIFLVTGAEKNAALLEVLHGEFNPPKFPAQIVNPTNGELIWLIENSAWKTKD